MGCESSRESSKPEEASIMLMEEALELFKNDSQMHDFILRKFSTEGKVSALQ